LTWNCNHLANANKKKTLATPQRAFALKYSWNHYSFGTHGWIIWTKALP
jgi:hypothetical protein